MLLCLKKMIIIIWMLIVTIWRRFHLFKKVCLREIPEPHHKDRKVNPVWNYYKKTIKINSTGMIKTQHAIYQVMVGGAICDKRMAMPPTSTTGPRNYLKNRHSKIWVEVVAIVNAKAQVKRGTDRVHNEVMNLIKGEKVEILINI